MSAAIRQLGPVMLAPSATEKHYSPQEVAATWGLHPKTIIRIFSDEPGVLRIGETGRRNKRDHVVLRIPQSVLERVYSERCKV